MRDDGRFVGTFRIPSVRLRGYDYASCGWYFVTICTKNKIPWFGRIRNGFVCLSDAGVVAETYWRSIPQHYPYARIDTFVMMPNHMHGIIHIDDDHFNTVVHPRAVVETHESCVSTMPSSSITTSIINPMLVIDPTRRRISADILSLIPLPRRQSGSLGSIIAQYKSACTKRIRDMGYADFGWQTRYYDHILRDQNAVDRVRGYILDNPWKWPGDDLE